MRISFDLDDTLICYRPGTPSEPWPAWYWRAFTSGEPLRRGARALLRELQARGHELWVYTTSHRPPLSVKLWLRAYGIRVARVINQDTHDWHFRRPGTYPPSKNPGAFGIDLHIDDSEGVRMEGKSHGFQVVVVAPDDMAWTEKVLRAVDIAEAVGK